MSIHEIDDLSIDNDLDQQLTIALLVLCWREFK